MIIAALAIGVLIASQFYIKDENRDFPKGDYQLPPLSINAPYGRSITMRFSPEKPAQENYQMKKE